MSVSGSLSDSRHIGRRRLDVARTLTPVARAIGLRRMVRAALLGFAAGAIGGAVILVVAHIRAFDFALPAAVLVAALGLLIGAAFGAAHWPGEMQAARAADLHFGLDDRLTTALELRGSDTPVASLQSRDLEQRIDGLALSHCGGRWLRRSEGGLVALAALALAGALALPPPSRAHRTTAPATTSSTKARHAAAKRVKTLTSQLHAGLTPAQLQSPAMRKLDAALARLRHQLLRASSPRTTLRAISSTQQQLRRLSQGLHPVNAKAVAQLNSSLSHYLNKGQAGNGRKSSVARSSPATARALNRLAQALARMTLSQRAALAQSLARTANATSDNALRQALRQSASALANGQPRSARTALQRAAQMLARSSAAQAAQSRTSAAQTQLNALRQQLASRLAGSGASPSFGPPSTGSGKQNAGAGVPGTGGKRAPGAGQGAGQGKGQKGQGQGQGNGKGQGKGQGRGQGRGSGQGRGTGQGQGQGAGQGRRGTGRGVASGRGAGQGQGRGTGTGARTGTAGAHGAGGRGTAARTRAGKTVTVFVPGKQGKGPTINRTGPNGAAAPGAVVPYQQVVGQYAQSAHQALDRAALPPSLQGYVRRYFKTLSR